MAREVEIIPQDAALCSSGQLVTAGPRWYGAAHSSWLLRRCLRAICAECGWLCCLSAGCQVTMPPYQGYWVTVITCRDADTRQILRMVVIIISIMV